MNRVLVICSDTAALDAALRPIHGRAEVIFRSTSREIYNVRDVEQLDGYTLIVVAPFFWKIKATAPSVVRCLRQRFMGPIVAAGAIKEWRKLMTDAGCDFTVSPKEAGAFVRDLLFPPS